MRRPEYDFPFKLPFAPLAAGIGFTGLIKEAAPWPGIGSPA